jgi:methanogenic corrinoid protein MtbC1
MTTTAQDPTAALGTTAAQDPTAALGATAPGATGGGPAAGAAAWADRLWEAVAESSEIRARDVVFAALEAGVGAEAVLLDVIAAVQTRVGHAWAANRLTVAQEHAATAINDRVVAALADHPALGAAPAPHRGRVTVACIDGEWHAFPARLLAQVLTLRGWHVDFLGAQVPTRHLVAHLHRSAPGPVALSASLATRLPTAHAAITACQAAGAPVLAGGAGFGPGGRYAYRMGADAWAPDARTAADRLAAGLLAPLAEHQPVDDLPHLSDQEYTMVTTTAPRLVAAVMAGLADRFPAMRDYTEVQLQHTAEDVAHIVDFLAAALYTDDAELFTGFLGWTAGILAARGVPPASLLPALDLLGRELRDLPRAGALLHHGTGAVEAAAGPAAGASRTPSSDPAPEPGGSA